MNSGIMHMGHDFLSSRLEDRCTGGSSLMSDNICSFILLETICSRSIMMMTDDNEHTPGVLLLYSYAVVSLFVAVGMIAAAACAGSGLYDTVLIDPKILSLYFPHISRDAVENHISDRRNLVIFSFFGFYPPFSGGFILTIRCIPCVRQSDVPTLFFLKVEYVMIRSTEKPALLRNDLARYDISRGIFMWIIDKF